MTPNHLQKLPELGQSVYISVCCAEWEFKGDDWVMGIRFKLGVVIKIDPHHPYNWTRQLITVALEDKSEHLAEAGELLESNVVELVEGVS